MLPARHDDDDKCMYIYIIAILYLFLIQDGFFSDETKNFLRVNQVYKLNQKKFLLKELIFCIYIIFLNSSLCFVIENTILCGCLFLCSCAHMRIYVPEQILLTSDSL